MKNLKYRLVKQSEKKMANGQTMIVNELKAVAVNRICKSCRIRERASGSSRCSMCKVIGKVIK